MRRVNRQFATKFAPNYAAMFERITQPQNLPALVHCTAGKDRAGFASAMILSTAASMSFAACVAFGSLRFLPSHSNSICPDMISA